MTQSATFYAQAQLLSDQLIAWRRDIHIHPELSFQEQRTARLVADTLAEFGIETQAGVGKTGVVGYLGEGSPVIGIRADMDALIQETNDVPYRSQTPGVMHACGHDAHTAILLGVAKLLAQMPDRPPGQVRFLFQPSEENSDSEGKSGAVRMIVDGALEGVDAVIALHAASDLPAGRITVEDGYSTANEDSFQITLTGTGGHGAMPHQTVDPANGRQAAEAARNKLYDVVLMDLHMPEVDGLEATRLIRQMPQPNTPRIVALTADAMLESRQACQAIGMDGCLCKPLKFEQLTRMLHKFASG